MRALMIVASLLGLVVVGCQQHTPPPPPAPLVSYSEAHKQDLRTVTISKSGYYGLYPMGHDRLMARFPLKAGEQLGFASHPLKATVSMEPGRIYGIAGNYDFSLPATGNYEWRPVEQTTMKEMTPLP